MADGAMPCTQIEAVSAAQITIVPIKCTGNSCAADLQTIFQKVSIRKTFMN